MSADTNVQIVDEIMGCITQTDVWFETLQNDPAITAAKARRDKVLEQVEALIPRDLYIDLEDAMMRESSTVGDAGILYGLRIVFALIDVASRPADLSRHILSRMGVPV